MGSRCRGIFFSLFADRVLIFFSFNKSPLGSFPFTGFTLDWYRELFDEYFLIQAFRNSLIVAGLTVPMATIIGTLCAFGLSRSEFRLKGLFTGFILMPMVVPGILLGAALLIVFVPVLGLRLSIWTAVAGHVVVTTPYAVLAVATRLYGQDRRLDMPRPQTSAHARFGVSSHVTLPLVMPGIVAAASHRIHRVLDTFGVTFFTVGTQGTLPMYIWAQVKTGSLRQSTRWVPC